MSLSECHIVIVGGSSGIGRGAAEALLGEGARVTIVGRSQEKLRAAKESMNTDNRLAAISADVTHEDEVKRLFDDAGAIDHLIVTRGIAPLNQPIESLDLNAARRFVEVMVISALSLAKHASPHVRRGGSITFTSGISKDKPGPSGGAVVAAVAGSMGYMARALALELAPTRVNVVSPGWVETPMWDEIVGPAKSQMWADMGNRVPAGRIATPADIAKAYKFLLESELTTGIVLNIDGGHSII